MGKVKFSKPYVVVSDSDAVIVDYPLQFQDKNQGDEQLHNHNIRMVMTGSLSIEYGVHPCMFYIPNYYDNFIIKMFPYVLDLLKKRQSIESYQITFHTDPPGIPQSEWDNTQPIEGYELEF